MPFNHNSYCREWYKERKAKGHCIRCANKFVVEGKTCCFDCLEKIRIRSQDYTKNNRETILRKARDKKTEIRKTLIGLLGGVCVCCGESKYEFLNFDHKDNDGHKHRRELGSAGHGSGLYKLMLKDPEQLAKFQLLCWNCNCSKGIHGFCPHSIERKN